MLKYVTSIRTLVASFALAATMSCFSAQAADLPLAKNSPMAGIPFSDLPTILPVDASFSSALQSAAGGLGRSCNAMESYGWQMASDEQIRVDRIFNETVEHLRSVGYKVEAKPSGSAGHDITLFTADHMDKHLLLLWSGGEIGLVLLMCETNQTQSSGPVPSMALPVSDASSIAKAIPKQVTDSALAHASDFNPRGKWNGSYVCNKKWVDGTLILGNLKNGTKIDGTFEFRATKKSPNVASGKYAVKGTYDRNTQKITLAPAKWLKKANGVRLTEIVGEFNAEESHFSGVFQGVSGCSSFEASRPKEAKKAIKHKKKGKKSHKTLHKVEHAQIPSKVEVTKKVITNEPAPVLLEDKPADKQAVTEELKKAPEAPQPKAAEEKPTAPAAVTEEKKPAEVAAPKEAPASKGAEQPIKPTKEDLLPPPSKN